MRSRVVPNKNAARRRHRKSLKIVDACRSDGFEGAVAMLVFLAGAAGAGLVAADLAPGARILRIALFRRHDEFGCSENGLASEIVLAGGGVEMMTFHGRQARRRC